LLSSSWHFGRAVTDHIRHLNRKCKDVKWNHTVLVIINALLSVNGFVTWLHSLLAYLSPGNRGLLLSKRLTFSGCMLSSSAKMHPTDGRWDEMRWDEMRWEEVIRLSYTRRTEKARQGKARQGKARQGKTRQGKARQGKARQGKARQGKARQGKAI
jgi:hypothetical protein